MSKEQLNLVVKTAFVLGAGYFAYRIVTAPTSARPKRQLPPPPPGTRPKLVRRAPAKRLLPAV